MNPCEFNITITAVTNVLFDSLSKEEFACLSLFLSELSKHMFATTVYQNTCNRDSKK